MVQLAQLSTWIGDQSHFVVQYIWNLMTLKLAIPAFEERKKYCHCWKKTISVNTWPCNYCPLVSRKYPGLYARWFKSIHWQENCNREELSTTYISGSILYLTFPCQKPWSVFIVEFLTWRYYGKRIGFRWDGPNEGTSHYFRGNTP